VAKAYPKKASCRTSGDAKGGCFRVEALISVDERGQTILPKELRDRNNIRAGDKFAVVRWEKDGEIRCLTVIKVDHLTESIRGLLGPLMGGVVGGTGQEKHGKDPENDTGRN
jgi:AbrB family looped-hinge helix DNA binding protein